MYRHVNAQLCAMAIQSLSNYLCYLFPELAVLAMFDTSVNDNEKLIMSTTLFCYDCSQIFAPGKPGQSGFQPVANILELEKSSLSRFITRRS